MKFSVVIPLYNKAPYIKRAIDSVLNQPYQDFEIIVVDDGSTDGGGDIVTSYSDPRIRLIRQENAGVSAARNKGIEVAKNEYIAFLDADDYWLNDHLETLSNLINLYPNCGMYATSFITNPDNRNKRKNKQKIIPINWHARLNLEGYLDLILNGHYICSDSICVWKPSFCRAGYFEVGLNRGEDIDMWLRIAVDETVAFINKMTTVYELNAINRSHNRFTPEKSVALIRLSKMINSKRFTDVTKEKLYEYYAQRMLWFGNEALRNGYRKETLRSLKESYKTKLFKIDFIILLIRYLISFIGINFSY